ncbi:hypothetical protein ABPG75_008080 [Micractinium tetrahymenae]
MMPPRSRQPAQLKFSPHRVLGRAAAMRAVLFWAVALLPALTGLVAAQATLRFDDSGALRIVQLADVHVGEGAADAHTVQLVRRVLAAERPGLAVLSGDMVSGFAFPAGDVAGRLGRLFDRGSSTHLTASWYERQWRRLVAPLHAAGVPYAAILGNHDGEADLGRRGVTELASAVGGSLSLTLPGPEGLPGGGNYWIDVLEPQGEAVAARIWMVDSGNRGCGQLAWGWGCVPVDTVEWVRQQAALLPRVPSLAFVHIPLPQHMLAWERGPVNGTKGEMVGCPGMDTGFFELAREVGITAVYSGHDHNNDFAGTVHGVRLAYGRKSGFGSYGPAGRLQHGARVIELRQGEDPAGSPTWIRQEDGSQQFQAAGPEDRPFRQHTCNLDASGCDNSLGPRACLALRSARNAATLLAVLAGLAVAATTTSLAAFVLARRVQQHLRRQRGWQQVKSSEKPLGPAAV